MTVTKQKSERRSDEKAFLFCPSCSRSASAEKGWSRDDHDGRTEVSCPDCEAIVVSQPSFDSEHRVPPIAAD